ncbi:MAG: hypothetical protein FWG52_01180 [Proteobacteria bacterium]|nr:hypothetical protein [Pseudomonadota bacterium]
MAFDRLSAWLQTLGYEAADESIHRPEDRLSTTHPYSAELNDLLRHDGQIRAHAVFDVQGFPTVAFFEDDGTLLSDPEGFARIRQRIWNQNLVAIVMVVDASGLIAYPPTKKIRPERLAISQASANGLFSAAEIRSGEVQQRLPTWFKPENRVDRQLLNDLGETVRQLEGYGYGRDVAQTLMGQVLFVSYLEHRRIVSDTYRQKRQVAAFHDLEPLTKRSSSPCSQ